jgi:hypothetical protein
MPTIKDALNLNPGDKCRIIFRNQPLSMSMDPRVGVPQTQIQSMDCIFEAWIRESDGIVASMANRTVTFFFPMADIYLGKIEDETRVLA